LSCQALGNRAGGLKYKQVCELRIYKKLPVHPLQLDILDLRVEVERKGVAPAAPFLFCRLGMDWDVVKKKAVSRRAEAKGRQATEQDDDGLEHSAVKEAGSEEKKQRPVRCIQRHTDVEFRRGFPKVFESLMEKAQDGGIQETRLLLQIGKFGDPKVAKRRGAKSLSEMLLDELKRRQDEREAAADGKRLEEQMVATNDTGGEGATSDSDAKNG
jgi:hypothetical protein